MRRPPRRDKQQAGSPPTPAGVQRGCNPPAVTSAAAASKSAASLVVGAQAATFTQWAVFGDSLSDAGNAAAITSNNVLPSPFPHAGPFTNGPNDMFLGLQTGADMAQVIGTAVTHLANDVVRPADMGATYIRVPGMTDLGKTPKALALGPVLSQAFSGADAGDHIGAEQRAE